MALGPEDLAVRGHAPVRCVLTHWGLWVGWGHGSVGDKVVFGAMGVSPWLHPPVDRCMETVK